MFLIIIRSLLRSIRKFGGRFTQFGCWILSFDLNLLFVHLVNCQYWLAVGKLNVLLHNPPDPHTHSLALSQSCSLYVCLRASVIVHSIKCAFTSLHGSERMIHMRLTCVKKSHINTPIWCARILTKIGSVLWISAHVARKLTVIQSST